MGDFCWLLTWKEEKEKTDCGEGVTAEEGAMDPSESCDEERPECEWEGVPPDYKAIDSLIKEINASGNRVLNELLGTPGKAPEFHDQHRRALEFDENPRSHIKPETDRRRKGC